MKIVIRKKNIIAQLEYKKYSQKMITPLHESINAPDFKLLDQNGTIHTLHQYRGTWILIYFYPKDNTPGCTTQACALRDAFSEFKKYNITILGISKDNQKSHKKFEVDHHLPFTLLSDTEAQVAKSYGVWGPKKFMGREYFGMHRVSFLIDPKGVIVKTYTDVNVLTHAQKILADSKDLISQFVA